MATDGFHEAGTGLTVFEHDEIVEGPVVWLDSPEAVLDFVGRDDASEWIVLARGGTTTFLTPALTAGVRAVMTLQGSPESHLGILAREYGIPCLMSVAFSEGVRSARGEVIPADGVRVHVDVTTSPQGRVSVEDGAPVVEGEAAAAAEDPEAAAQAEMVARLMAAYNGEIPGGEAGDRVLRRRLRTGIVETDEASIRRDLSADEIGEFLTYAGWNLWDLIAARQTEGESGLIPRQEYETVSFVQGWATYASWYRRIEEAIGVDGIVELGGLPRREIGTKVNHVHHWAHMTPLLGRGIATTMGLESPEDRLDDLATIIQFQRRVQHGLWGGGPGFVSGRGYTTPILDRSWLDRFRDEERRLDEPEALEAFRRFNATTELCGFLIHYDCRAGLCDTGPYPLEDGGFMIVRDHFLHEPTYEWASVVDDLPHCVTQAMFFRPDGEQEIAINDIATTFAKPANYLKHLSGAVVYARDRWDTPMSDVRVLEPDEMERIVGRCNDAMTDLYSSIGSLSWDERIRNGVKVYCRDFVMPYARRAGVWDEFLADGFDDLAPLTEKAYPALVGGEAQELLGGVFLTGLGVLPGGTLPQGEPLSAEAATALHALAIRGSLAAVPGDVGTLVDDGLATATPSGFMLTAAGRLRHEAALAAEREAVDREALERVYDRFLEINGRMKSVLAQGHPGSGGHDELLGSVGQLLETVEPALRRTATQIARFGGYQERLRAAFRRAQAGDPAFLTDPTVDSVHNVWMEVHEDFLRVLDRSRELEGSY